MSIISNLASFNRKERFYLVAYMLKNTQFELSEEVKTLISEIINVPIPDSYFTAMDYHLDWIYASLHLENTLSEQPFLRDRNCIKGTQEDVDFIIAFEDTQNITHIVMIEAKGDSSFTSKQLESKALRLKHIFGEEKCKWTNVQPHFLLCSPKKTSLLKPINFPHYLLNKNNELTWFELPMPKSGLQKIIRSNESSNPKEDGDYWITSAM